MGQIMSPGPRVAWSVVALVVLAAEGAWAQGQGTVVPASAAAPATAAPTRVAEGALGRLVPSDAALYFHYEADVTRRMAELLPGFRDALATSGFFDSFTDAFLASLKRLRDALAERAQAEPNERARERFAAEVQRLDQEIQRRGFDGKQWERILADIEWWKLFTREIAVVARVQPSGQREWLFALRSTEDERDQRLAELQQALYGLGAVIPGLELLVSERHGVPVTVLFSVFTPGDELCIGGVGDVVLVATSRGLLRRACQLAEGAGSDVGLAGLPRFRASVDALAHSAEFFGDTPFSTAGFQFLVEPARLLHEVAAVRGLRRYTLAGDVVNDEILYASTTEFVDVEGGEDGDVDEGADVVDEGADVAPVAEIFLERAELRDFAELVPSGVDWFSASTGSEPELTYEFLVSVLRQSMLIDDAVVDQLELQAEELTTRIRSLLLNQLTGRRAVFRRGGSWVAVWEFAKPLRAATDAWKELATYLDETARTVFKESPAGGDLRELSGPFPLSPTLTVGAVGDLFVIATSPDALKGVRQARRGVNTILSDTAFAGRWPEVAGELHAVSYGDAATLVGWLAAGFRVGPGLLRTTVPLEDTVLAPLLGALERLAPALGKLDFVGTSVARTVRDGNRLQGAGRIQLQSPGRRGF